MQELKNIIIDHDVCFRNLSRIYVNNTLICYGLDPLILDSGVYSIECNYSPRFKKTLPLLYNDKFPASRGFRIHAGNTLKDSQGCILAGMKFQVDTEGNITLVDSKVALNKLLSVVEDIKVCVILS